MFYESTPPPSCVLPIATVPDELQTQEKKKKSITITSVKLPVNFRDELLKLWDYYSKATIAAWIGGSNNPFDPDVNYLHYPTKEVLLKEIWVKMPISLVDIEAASQQDLITLVRTQYKYRFSLIHFRSDRWPTTTAAIWASRRFTFSVVFLTRINGRRKRQSSGV
jgi:hypothetical protein